MLKLLSFLVAAGMAFAPIASAMDLDPGLTPYQKVSGVSGSVKSVGSDT
jgi:hypothetical protein